MEPKIEEKAPKFVDAVITVTIFNSIGFYWENSFERITLDQALHLAEKQGGCHLYKFFKWDDLFILSNPLRVPLTDLADSTDASTHKINRGTLRQELDVVIKKIEEILMKYE